MVGWPANGNSRTGVKMRTRAEWAGFCGFSTNTVSDRLSSRAMALHLRSAQRIGLADDSQRIAAEGAIGEDVERVQRQRHASHYPH